MRKTSFLTKITFVFLSFVFIFTGCGKKDNVSTDKTKTESKMNMTPVDWSQVEKVFEKKGAVQDNVFKITFPRSDLNVKVGNFAVSPGLALTSWVGFMKTTDHTVMMGDMVLLDSEVTKVLSKLTSEGLLVTALHNHLINETPAVKYMHFSGSGNAVELAEKIKSVLSLTGTPLTQSPTETHQQSPDWSKVTSILGLTGKQNGNLLVYGFPRNDKLTESKMEMPAYMGIASGINFQTEGNKTAVAGDFVLLADEVNPVMKALTENGISVTAIHNHMLYDEPRLFMMHFWAVGDAGKLAQGIKEALEKTNTKGFNK